MTSSVELRSLLASVEGFLGVFPADQLPAGARPGDSLVANYSDAGDNDGGSHWIGLKIQPDGNGEYFDSFGDEFGRGGPDSDDAVLGKTGKRRTHFREWLIRHSQPTSKYTWNHFDFQGMGSDVCGEYAALFVIIGGGPENPLYRHQWSPLMRLPTAAARDRRVRELIGIKK